MAQACVRGRRHQGGSGHPSHRGSGHAYRASWLTRHDDRAVPARCGCRSLPRADASRTNGGTCGSQPAASVQLGAPPARRRAARRSDADDACASAHPALSGSRDWQGTATTKPDADSPQSSSDLPREMREELSHLLHAHGFRMTHTVVARKRNSPAHIHLGGARTVASQRRSVTELVQKAHRGHAAISARTRGRPSPRRCPSSHLPLLARSAPPRYINSSAGRPGAADGGGESRRASDQAACCLPLVICAVGIH